MADFAFPKFGTGQFDEWTGALKPSPGLWAGPGGLAGSRFSIGTRKGSSEVNAKGGRPERVGFLKMPLSARKGPARGGVYRSGLGSSLRTPCRSGCGRRRPGSPKPSTR